MSKLDFAQRLKDARKAAGLTQKSAAKLADITQPTLSQLESGAYDQSVATVALANAYGVDPTWLATGKGMAKPGAKTKEVLSEHDYEGETGAIPYWDARGSCGGGFLNYEQMPVGHLVKEASFFKRYNLSPANAIAIYADGDSMSDFIVDGDIVIFDTSKTEPKSGKIFLLEHPDGLRIKQLRRDIDGSWVLESRNPDKRKFPDERVEPERLDFLKLHGEFVYRQGG
ncbi:XRE family transcriptional regulator [Achromobacter denitrificans]